MKDYRLAIGRVFLLAALLAHLPAIPALAHSALGCLQVHDTHLLQMGGSDGCTEDEYAKDKKW